MNLHDLKSHRATKVAELRAINEKAMNDRRDLNEDERKQFDAIDKETRSLNDQIDRAEKIALYDRFEAEAEPITARGDTMANIERRFKVGRALAEFSEKGRLSGAEAEYAAEHRSGRPGAIAMPTRVFLGGETRAITTGGSGGNLVDTEVGPEIDRLRPLLAVERLGATVLSNLTENIDLRRNRTARKYRRTAHSAPRAR